MKKFKKITSTKENEVKEELEVSESSQETQSEEIIEPKTIKHYSDGQLTKEDCASLEDLLNPNYGGNPFKTSNEEEFDKNIGDMTLPEMQSLAVELGVFPSGNKSTLKNKLKKEFSKKYKTGKGKMIESTGPILNVEGLSPEQKKLFNID